jgi:thiol:disulfide interchange protein
LDERKRLLDFLKELNMLQNVYGQLEAVGNEIAIYRGHRDIIPNLKTMMATVNAFQRNLNGLRPELFGDKPKQSRQERMIQSAKLNVERQKALVNDFNSQKDQSFKFNPKTQQFDQHAMVDGEDLERAKVRLHQAEDQLDLLQGTLEEKRREQQKAAEEKAKEERLEFAQSRVAWKERIKARQQEQGVKP